MPPAPEPSVAGDRDTPRTFDDGDVGVLLAGLVDGLTVHDEGGRYLQVSASFEELTGFGAAQLTGHSPFDLELFHPEDVDHAVEVQADALRTGEPWRLLYRLQRSDGAFVWVESTGRAIDHEDGLRFVVVTREAAQHESLIQQLGHERQTRLQLDELAARQQRFLTIMSHRARTPLTSVLGMAQTLQAHGDDLDPARRQALLERLRGNAEDLMHLLDDVIEADHLTRADVMLKRRVVGVRALVEEVVADMTGALDTVTIDVPHDLRAVIDRAKVARMLETLLGNAFKHAGVGAAVRMAAESTNEGIKLVVEDDGPGIPAAVRDEIFQPFFQADPDDADPGAGLGLYLVSELAGLHLGRAWATDRPGGGARLCVSLPRPRADAPVADSTAAEADDQAASALRPAAHRFVTRLLSTLRDRVDMDLVYLSVLDDTAQHVLAGAGKLGVGGVEPGRRMPLEDTFCARMVNDELDHVVGDTSAHPVTADLPPTADGLACWIGVPVHLPSGQVLGTLCCADSAPRPELSQAAADELRSFAQILGDQLADEGFIDGTAFDATGRVANVLTTDAAMHTVLQPIVELDGGSVSGLEALARFPGHDPPPGRGLGAGWRGWRRWPGSRATTARRACGSPTPRVAGSWSTWRSWRSSARSTASQTCHPTPTWRSTSHHGPSSAAS